MLTRIRIWMEALKQTRKEKEFERGFDYAAGELLRNEFKGLKLLKSEIDIASLLGEKTNFDKGIESAIDKWEKWNNSLAGSWLNQRMESNIKQTAYCGFGDKKP